MSTRELWKDFMFEYLRQYALFKSSIDEIEDEGNELYHSTTAAEHDVLIGSLLSNTETWEVLSEETWNILIGIIPEYAAIRVLYV